MANLHASLRSVLPLEYIKGKRSMSDHINEDANYVKDLKNKINELSAKRDEPKKMSDSSVNPAARSSNNYMSSRFGGLEVVIGSRFREQGFQVSAVLEILFKEGIDVVSCVSTKGNQMLLFTIHTEVSDPTCIDLPGLQQKLIEVIP